jgi:acyl-CoA synthetase (AMP-forming)/AMP-acid ligase II
MAPVSGSCCLLENRPEFFVWLLALNRIGASVVPVNPDLRHSELTYMAGHSEPSLIIGLANGAAMNSLPRPAMRGFLSR